MIGTFNRPRILAVGLVFLTLPAIASPPAEQIYVNSLGMKLIRIKPGHFLMGSTNGDFDEQPVHKVNISRPLYVAATEVTNAQYEQFDPAHKKFRGKRGISKNDDEAVVFVSWHEATQFCQWLSKKEGQPYRLPTEAEWEYVCRAGTTTPFFTGEKLPKPYLKRQKFRWDPKPVDLTVGQTAPNAWCLHDMHGNVEEWCYDWYGPYMPGEQTDPIGRITSDMKVTRGGSHNTQVTYLRSANRLGTLADDKHWLIGFRVVRGELPHTPPLPESEKGRWARDVTAQDYDWRTGPPRDKPYFKGPRRFVNFPQNAATIPMYHHNHCPSITWCPNGDLLAVWFSTQGEQGREMVILGTRLRANRDTWDPPSLFFDGPDRNMTGSALWNDEHGTLFHFNGLEAAGGWANLALAMRTSRDNGVTWQTPQLIDPNHRLRNQVISGTIRTQENYLIQLCDAVYGPKGGTALHISQDGGLTWKDPGLGKRKPKFAEGATGAWIAGIHASVVQLNDGSLLALGRENNIDGRMPMSLSNDLGETWTYHASAFPPIAGRQRLVLMRLREGPILLVSFTDATTNVEKGESPKGLLIHDAAGNKQQVYGMFAALSFDEGKTWPIKKLITPGHPTYNLTGGIYDDWRPLFKNLVWALDPTHSEPMGYLAACQSPNGMIHLISTAMHYEFNLAWLKTPSAITKPAP